MSWPPENHFQVFDERALKSNLVGYLRANQRDALTWAKGDSSTALPDIRQFNTSPRLVTLFPAVTILQTEHSTAFGDDILGVVLSMVIELAVAHGNQDTLTDIAAKYAMALESLLANMPETTLGENSIIPITSTIRDMETVFDLQGKIKNQFIQVSQTRVNWIIDASVENA